MTTIDFLPPNESINHQSSIIIHQSSFIIHHSSSIIHHHHLKPVTYRFTTVTSLISCAHIILL